jgi:hypothetical protein
MEKQLREKKKNLKRKKYKIGNILKGKEFKGKKLEISLGWLRSRT